LSSFLLRAVLLGSTFGVSWVLAERVDILPQALRHALSQSYTAVSSQLRTFASGRLVWDPPRSGDELAALPDVAGALEAGAPPLPGEADEPDPAPAVPGLYLAIEPTSALRGPREDAQVLGVIPLGAKLSVSERTSDGQWYRISWQGASAYTSARLLQPINPPELQRIDKLLAEADEFLRSAALDQARGRLELARVQLKEVMDVPGAGKRVARLELLMGTVYLAVGLEREADKSLAKALTADPTLELDPDTSPRKLRRRVSRLRLGLESSALN
jgi:hypothetical protein